MDVIVVGAGLFGSIAATLARKRGASVTVIDSGEAYAASQASGCVLKPSWLSSLSKEEIATGYGVLNSLYSVQDLVFRANLGVTVKAQHVNPRKIIVKPDRVGKVVKVRDGVVTLLNGEVLRGKVLIAAGIWSQGIIDMPPIKGLFGASLRFPRQQLPEPRLVVYAPYRQAVALNIDKDVWMGDGTALIEKSWSLDRIDLTVARANDLFGLTGAFKYNVGARPYVEGHKGGFYARRGNHTWISTGGAKNGTMLAALFAHRFVKELKL